MKGILINENMPSRLASILTEAGLIAEHVSEVQLNGRPDAEVLARALSHELAILTKDSDYVDLILSSKDGKLVLVRVGNMRLAPLIQHVRSRLEAIRAFLESDERILIL